MVTEIIMVPPAVQSASWNASTRAHSIDWINAEVLQTKNLLAHNVRLKQAMEQLKDVIQFCLINS